MIDIALNPTIAKPLLCSRCEFLAVNFIRSKVFVLFFGLVKNIFDK